MLELLVKPMVCNRHVHSLCTQPGPALQPSQRALKPKSEAAADLAPGHPLTWMRWTMTLQVPAGKL